MFADDKELITSLIPDLNLYTCRTKSMVAGRSISACSSQVNSQNCLSNERAINHFSLATSPGLNWFNKLVSNFLIGFNVS